MAFDLTNLAAYTEQERLPLLTKSIAGAKTQKLITPQTGIKSSAALNLLDTDVIMQQGGTCGFSPSGTTTLSQRTITVGRVKVHEKLCPKDLEAYWAQITLKGQGSNPDNIPFEQAYTDLKASKIALAVETTLWQGDTSNGDANLQRFDGFLKLIANASGIITGNPTTGGGWTQVTTGTGITTSNVLGIFQKQYSLIPVDVLDKDDVRSFCGWDVFRTLLNAITSANLYHYDTDDAAQKGELMIPGTSLKVIAVNGLNGTNQIVSARLSNLFYGTDLEGEDEQFDMFYAREAMEVRFVCEFKMGAQFAFPDQIVNFKLA